MVFVLSKIIRYVFVIIVFYQLCQYILQNKSYSFPVSKFKKHAIDASKMKNGLSAVNNFIGNMKNVNPMYAVKDSYWVQFSFGGLNLNGQFVSTLLTEASVVFHAPLRTSGRSGMHWANVSCVVLSGSVYRSKDILNGGFKETFSKGDDFRHGQFEGAIYEFAEDTFISCYGRGIIPLSGLHPTIGGLTSCDFFGVLKMLIAYTKGLFDSYSFYFQTLFFDLKNKVTRTEL
uniref:Sigma non-opioid intracellular receptor 1 n=1 Tax=Parastrongyloides trichosuri TaxID=131310 RepID=A0A0N4ZZ36_PARTI